MAQNRSIRSAYHHTACDAAAHRASGRHPIRSLGVGRDRQGRSETGRRRSVAAKSSSVRTTTTRIGHASRSLG